MKIHCLQTLLISDLTIAKHIKRLFFKVAETESEGDLISVKAAELDPLTSIGIEQPPWESLSK